MEDLISPKYLMTLARSVHDSIWEEYKTYKEVRFYINKWHHREGDYYNSWENFEILLKENKEIDLLATLHEMNGNDLLRIAIDMGIETPDFIPSIPSFRNELKADYKTASATFTKAFRQIDSDPSLAIGLANSALESIIKEILKDSRISSKVSGNETLYKLAMIIFKEFSLIDNNLPKEIKTIGNSLLTIGQSIEKVRSEMTDFHGKTESDRVINDSVYAHLIVNAVTTVGLFLNSYYKTKLPKPQIIEPEIDDDLPF